MTSIMLMDGSAQAVHFWDSLDQERMEIGWRSIRHPILVRISIHYGSLSQSGCRS